MAARNRIGKGGEAAWMQQSDRYIRRLLDDEQLRANLLGAYSSARNAYGRLGNGKGPTHALFEDPKLQQELIDAANALRDASSSLMEAPSRRRRRSAAPARRGRGLRRSLMLAIVGAALAIALSAEVRSKVLDLLFGAEEEFDYTSTTAPSTAAPAGAAAAS